MHHKAQDHKHQHSTRSQVIRDDANPKCVKPSIADSKHESISYARRYHACIGSKKLLYAVTVNAIHAHSFTYSLLLHYYSNCSETAAAAAKK